MSTTAHTLTKEDKGGNKMAKLKGYGYTGRYSWTKKRAEERAKKARKKGYDVKVVSASTKKKRRKGYALFAKTTPKGYGFQRTK
jgi:hypothetical protein